MFFLSPYIIGKLDAVSYGIWSILNVLTGYMGLFDLGVRASVGRHIALYLGKQDEEGVDETIRAGLGFFSLTGGFILLIGVLLGWFFPEIFRDVPQAYHRTVRILLPLMVVNVWLSAISAIYSSTLAAHYRFDVARSVDLTVLTVRSIGTVWFLSIGWGLWGMLFAMLAGNVLAAVLNRVCAGYYHSNLRSWPFLYSRKRLKEILNYGLGAFLFAISTKIISQTDLIIAGAFLSIASVREYSVGAMIVYYSSTLIKTINRTYFPAVQRAIGGNQMEEARHFFYRQVNIALCFSPLIFLGFAVYSKPFIRLWMLQENFGENAVISSAEIMTILAIAQLPLSYTRASLDFLAAKGHIYLSAGILLIEALTNVFLSLFFVLVLDWGLPGIAFGTLFSRIAVSGLWAPIFMTHIVRLPLSPLIFKNLLPAIIASALFAIFCVFWRWVVPPSTWWAFWTNVSLVTLFWFCIAVRIILPKEYRIRLIEILKKKLGLKKQAVPYD